MAHTGSLIERDSGLPVAKVALTLTDLSIFTASSDGCDRAPVTLNTDYFSIGANRRVQRTDTGTDSMFLFDCTTKKAVSET
jgi:hypothetical protein